MRGTLGFWLVALVAFGIGVPALGGDYVYDDQLLVLRNSALQNADVWALLTQPLFQMEQGYWRPITLLVLTLGHHCGGASGIHLIALLLHAGNAMLVFGIARRWLSPSRAILPTLLFAVHPVQVESVGWCAAINDPLWVTFGLLAMHTSQRWRDVEVGQTASRGVPWLSATCVLAALLTKETGIASVPLVLATLGLVPGPGRVRWRAAIGTLVGTVIAWFLLRCLVMATGSTTAATATSEAQASANGDPVTMLLSHLLLLVKPLPATPFRSLPELSTGSQVAAILGLAALLAGVILWAKRTQLHREAIWFGAAVVLLPILPPVANWQSVGAHPVCDRYVYLSVFGAALTLTTRDWFWRHRFIAWIAWFGVVVTAGVTLAQFGKWQSQRNLTEYAISVAPTDPTLLVMAGDEALQQARAGSPAAWPIARTHYRNAIEHTPAAQGSTVRRTLSAGLLGIAWCDLMQPGIRRKPGNELIAGFAAATRTGIDNPAAWVGLGVACASLGRAERAREAFTRAVEIDPEHREAWYNRAFLEFRLGDHDAARRHISRALEIDPTNAAIRQLERQLPPSRSGH